MTQIRLIKQEELIGKAKGSTIEYEGSIGDYIVEKYYGKQIPYSVYAGIPSKETEITFDIDALCNGHDFYTVMETPGTGLEVAAWLLVASLVVTVYLISNLPDPPKINNKDGSSPNNNTLGQRTNVARPLERIPDIKGQVKSIPDIIMPPYTRYEGNSPIEYGYYCVGRKKLSINTNTPDYKVYDGDTPISRIIDSQAEIFYPNNNHNIGSPDILLGKWQINEDGEEEYVAGTPIDRDIVIPYRSNEVNGIDLISPQESGATPISCTSSTIPPASGQTIMLVSTNVVGDFMYIYIYRGGAGDWLSPDYYVGNSIVFNNFQVSDLSVPGLYTLNGTYEITAIAHTPGSNQYGITIAYDFADMPDSSEAVSIINQGSFTTASYAPFFNWYYMRRAEFDNGWFNIYAPNGLYYDNGGSTYGSVTLDFAIEVEELDNDTETPTGIVQSLTYSITGRDPVSRGYTIDFGFATPTKFRARIKRTTAKLAASNTVYVDKIKIVDLMGTVDLDPAHDFGDVTTIYTKTIGNESATSVKERQLNCIVTEMLYRYQGGGEFSNTLSKNRSAIQSYISDFTDKALNGRIDLKDLSFEDARTVLLEDIDADGLLDLEDEIFNYFDSSKSTRFDYTLDDQNMTMQEYTQLLFNTINCVAYREGSKVTAFFEKRRETPSFLFTHRSKLPDGENYTRRFNLDNINDGIELVYTDPDTNNLESVFVPSDRIFSNPRKIEFPQIRNVEQATIRAYREYNKNLNQKISLELTTTPDGVYVRPGDVISVVKGSRTYTQDGEVLSVDNTGYILTLSQDITFETGYDYFIILKKDDGSLEQITITEGDEPNIVVLDDLPTFSVRTGIDHQRRTEFCVQREDREKQQWFIARSIDNSDRNSVKITAVNYSDTYYENDFDFVELDFNEDFNNDFY